MRPLTYAFKGFTPDQVRAVRDEQLRQAAARQEQKVREKDQEKNWDLVQVSPACVMDVLLCECVLCLCAYMGTCIPASRQRECARGNLLARDRDDVCRRQHSTRQSVPSPLS